MAWRNIMLTSYAYQSEITNLALCSMEVPGANSLPSYINFTPVVSFPTGKLCGDDSNYIMVTKSGNLLTFTFYYNGTAIAAQSGDTNSPYNNGYIAAVDDETGKAYFLALYKDERYSWIGAFGGSRPPWTSQAFNEQMYAILTGAEYHQYNWTSVPAISGKNGILLPMSTLNDINDGNEVTTSDTSKFNLNDSSNIKSLVDAVVNDF